MTKYFNNCEINMKWICGGYLCLNIFITVGNPVIKRGELGSRWTGLTLPHFLPVLSQDGFPTSYVMVYICSVSSFKMRSNVCFVYISGINYQHCWNFLFRMNFWLVCVFQLVLFSFHCKNYICIPDSLILSFTIKTRFLFQITLSGHDNYIHSLALKNGNTCASASEDGTVKIWGN